MACLRAGSECEVAENSIFRETRRHGNTTGTWKAFSARRAQASLISLPQLRHRKCQNLRRMQESYPFDELMPVVVEPPPRSSLRKIFSGSERPVYL
jgi:hypothetical protein